jgi:hypothetical protein
MIAAKPLSEKNQQHELRRPRIPLVNNLFVPTTHSSAPLRLLGTSSSHHKHPYHPFPGSCSSQILSRNKKHFTRQGRTIPDPKRPPAPSSMPPFAPEKTPRNSPSAKGGTVLSPKHPRRRNPSTGHPSKNTSFFLTGRRRKG